MTGYNEISDYDSTSLYGEDGVSACAINPRAGQRHSGGVMIRLKPSEVRDWDRLLRLGNPKC